MNEKYGQNSRPHEILIRMENDFHQGENIVTYKYVANNGSEWEREPNRFIEIA